MEDLAQVGKVPFYELSTIDFLCGNRDRAFRRMETAAAKHEFKGSLPKQLDPLFDRIGDHREFVARLHRAGIER